MTFSVILTTLVALLAEAREGEPDGRLRDEDIKALLDPPAQTATQAPAPPAQTPAPAPARPADVELTCPTAGEVQAGDELTFRCVTSGNVKPASVILFYKRAGGKEFAPVPMRSSSSLGRRTTWVAQILSSEVRGRGLPFYFEARDEHDAVMALSGRSDSPHLITIHGDEDTETVVAWQEQDEENPLLEEARTKQQAVRPWRMFVSLGVGSGAGYAKGNGIEAYRKYVSKFQPGLAHEGLLHVVPEIGCFVTPNFALSLQGRNQFITNGDENTARSAHTVLARALFFSGPAPDAFNSGGRFYGALALGGGDGFRLVVTSRTADDRVINDTVRGGPVVVGGGGGFSYAIGSIFSWTIEASLLAGLPTFSAIIDVNTGLRAAF